MKYRRVLCILMAALCCAALLGCQRQPAEPMTAEQMEQGALAVLELLISGDVPGAYEATSISFQYMYEEEGFAYAWDNALRLSGKITSEPQLLLSRRDTEEDYIIEYGCDAENIGIVLRIGFSGNEITYYSFSHYDFRDETTLPEGVSETAVSFVTEDGVTIHGLVTLPTGDGEHAAAVLIPGAGGLHMDSPYGRVKIMRDLAYGLAERGVASIRINKKSYETTDIFMLASSIESEFLIDYEQAYNLLADFAEVDANRIFLLGHSLGGQVAPRLDGRVDSAGMIIMGGSDRPYWEQVYDVNVAYVNLNPNIELLNLLTQEREKAQRLERQNALDAQQTSIFGRGGYYFWEQIHNKADLSKVTKPLLIMRGSGDFFMNDADWLSLKNGYTSADLTVLEYDGLNHLFVPSGDTGTADDYFFTGGRVAEDVMDDIADFIGD